MRADGDLEWVDELALAGATYVIRSAEAGRRDEVTCSITADSSGGVVDRPSCTVTDLGNGEVQLTWDARDIENDNYQVRVDGRWRASVPADGPLTWVGEAGAAYIVRSDEAGARLDYRCE